MAKEGTFAGHAYDPVITSRTYLASASSPCGYPDQCQRLLDQAVAEAERFVHLPTIAFVVFQIVELGYERRQPEITRIGLKRLVPLAREQGYAQFVAMAIALEGWIKATEGEYEAGCAKIREGTKVWEGIGNLLMRPFLLSLLTDAYIRASRGEEALRVSADALAFIAAKGEVLWEPELHWLSGDAWLLLPDGRGEAEACYTRAIEVARRQGAKLVELRAATSLARVWSEQDRQGDAQGLLAPVYDWFTEGFETADLKAAKALLDELR